MLKKIAYGLLVVSLIAACKKDETPTPETPTPENNSIFGAWEQISFIVHGYPDNSQPFTYTHSTSPGELRYVFASDSTYLRTSNNSLYPRDSGYFHINGNIFTTTGDSAMEFALMGITPVANNKFTFTSSFRTNYPYNDSINLYDSMLIVQSITLERR